MILNLDVLYFSILPGRDSKNFEIHCHGCSVHIYEKIRSAIKGETGIEGESRITRSPLYFRASGLRGKIIEGESEWESFGIICFEWNPILECHQSSTQES